MSIPSPTPPERVHHWCSPSTLQPREACGGFQNEHTYNPKAERGTFIHDCIEQVLKKEKLNPLLDDDEAKVVLGAAHFISQLIKEMGPGTGMIIEDYLPIDREKTTAGYLDVGLINRKAKRAKVVDWKTGEHPVEPAINNLQGMAYMLGLEYAFPGEIDECEVIFVMPFQEGEGLIDSHIFLKEQFDTCRLRIKTVVARAKDIDNDFSTLKILETYKTKLNPTQSTCLFCARKGVCPALHDLVLIAGRKYDPLLVPDEINPMKIKNSKQAGAALKFFSIMEGLAKAYRAKAAEKALNDEMWMPDGFYITQMSSRKILDNVKFAEIIRPLLTPEEFLRCITFTLGPLEKAIADKTPLGGKQEAVEDLARLLEMGGATIKGEPIIQLRQRKKNASNDSISLPD